LPGAAPPPLGFNGGNNRADGWSYDADGNLLNDGAHTYQYDVENRLTSVDGGATASYVYDAEGRRVHENVGGMVKEYVYGASGQLTITDGSQNLIAGETYVGGRYLGTQGPSGFSWAHTDELGTVRARSNAGGGRTETDISWPFGEFAIVLNGTSQIHFTGKLKDTEDNLDYFGARYYNSNLGRFMSPDWSEAPMAVPYANLENPQSFNLYSYVLNNPVTDLDADGHTEDSPDPSSGGAAAADASGGIGSAGGPDVDCCDAVLPMSGAATAAAKAGGNGVLASVGELLSSAFSTAADAVAGPVVAVFSMSTPAGSAHEDQVIAKSNAEDTARAKADRTGGGRNAQESNPDRVEAARQKYAELRDQWQKAKARPNKTPSDVATRDRLERAMKQQLDRMRDSENHSQLGKGGI